MSEISPIHPSFPKDIKIYKQDFARGSKLVKKASENYYQATEPHKKEQLKKSMNETIKAMNEILNNVLHEKGKKYEKKILDDYKKFINNTNSETMKKLNNDIDNIKKSL